jgi:hypothetical protein
VPDHSALSLKYSIFSHAKHHRTHFAQHYTKRQEPIVQMTGIRNLISIAYRGKRAVLRRLKGIPQFNGQVD